MEIVDDDIVLRGEAGVLACVKEVRRDNLEVAIEAPDHINLPTYSGDDVTKKHVLLRRWDHQIRDAETVRVSGDHTLELTEDVLIPLEAGVQICFTKASSDSMHFYRSGNYWLIPARSATGDVESPKDGKGPIPCPPHGVQHYYAPLAVVKVLGNAVPEVNDCRRLWDLLGK